MINKETEKLKSEIISRTIGNDSEIKLFKILNSSAPKSIKNYFLLQSEKYFVNEISFKFETQRFDLNAYDVRKSLNRFENSIKENCIFAKDEFINLLDKVITLQIEYLSDPLKNLPKFLFKDGEIINTKDIASSMKIFVDYPFYNEVFLHYIEEKQIESLEKNEYISILEKINSAVLKRFDKDEIPSLIKPLTDFINFPETDYLINIDIARLFFNNLGYFGISDSLILEKTIRGKDFISFEDLSLIIRSLDDVFKKSITEPPIIAQNSIQESYDDSDDKKNEPPIDSKSKSFLNEVKKAEEVQKEVVSKPKDRIQKIFESSDFESEATIFTRKDTKDMEVITIFQEKTNRQDKQEKTTNTSSINTSKFSFSAKEEKLIIKKLFNKDSNKYKKALSDLAKCNNWIEAANYIDHLFIQFEIDPYSDLAVEFTNKIQTVFVKETPNDH